MKKKILIFSTLTLLIFLGIISQKLTAQKTAEIVSSSRAQLTIDGQVKTLEALDGEFERIILDVPKTIKIQIGSHSFNLEEPIILEANNGGNLNGKLEPRQTIQPGEPLQFNFSVGGHRGLYTVSVKQGQRRELFEFWVGTERPIGQAGPKRVFRGE